MLYHNTLADFAFKRGIFEIIHPISPCESSTSKISFQNQYRCQLCNGTMKPILRFKDDFVLGCPTIFAGGLDPPPAAHRGWQ